MSPIDEFSMNLAVLTPVTMAHSDETPMQSYAEATLLEYMRFQSQIDLGSLTIECD